MTQTDIAPHDVNVLAVDDTAENLRLLTLILNEHGYQVRAFSDGNQALLDIKAQLPDLVLLDIMMPDMDGYEVCQALKADELTRDIPVIFISALNDATEKVKGFTLGAVDYITKPFETSEVLSRVRTHVGFYRMQRQLQAQNAQLQQEIAERQRTEAALHEANATKDTFFSILAHDLRSPFSSVLGSAEIALTYFDQLQPEELREHLTRIKTSAERFYALLENLLTWARIQRGRIEYQPENIPVQDMFTHLLELFAEPARQKHIALQQAAAQPLSVYADINMFHTILRNLVSNALKFTPAGGSVTLTVRARDDQVDIGIVDTGVGIANMDFSDLVRIDRKTITPGTAGEYGTGLGLSLCQELVVRNHGSLRIESAPGQGTTVTVSLPAPVPVHPSADEVNGAYAEHLIRLFSAAPADWLARLLSAMETFNLTETKALIEAVQQEHPALADALTHSANQFQFETIQALCQHAIRSYEKSC